jgi:hypothetical protein
MRPRSGHCRDGGSVPMERIDALRANIREVRPGTARKRPVLDPTGMTPERALRLRSQC